MAEGPSRRLSAFNVQAWLKEHRHELVPPVGNKLLFDGEFKVMMVAGPNSRRDYHVEDGEEWFYQLVGDMTLKVVDGGEFYDVEISEGSTFCLPPRVPHSPQRSPGSIGIVVERQRREGELDTLRWYCEQCKSVLYQESFYCSDLVEDLPPIIQRYKSDRSKRACKSCGWEDVL